MHFSRFDFRLMIAAACAALLLPGMAHAVVAGDPNAGTDIHGNPYPADTIANHTIDNAQIYPFGGIGDISGGTGSLLDSTHVLTAAHLFNPNGNISGINFTLNAGGSHTDVIPISAVMVAPNYQGFGGPGDLAIVTLSRPAQANAPFYSLYQGTLTPSSTVFTFVGYGASGYGTMNTTSIGDDTRTKRLGENVFDGYLQPDNTITTTDASGNQIFTFDFDSPDGSKGALGGASLGNTSEANIAGGDSGSPFFVQVGGQYQIAGIAGFNLKFNDTDPTATGFGGGGGGQLIAPYTSFIGSFVPAPEPTPLAVFGVGIGLLIACRRATHRKSNGD